MLLLESLALAAGDGSCFSPFGNRRVVFGDLLQIAVLHFVQTAVAGVECMPAFRMNQQAYRSGAHIAQQRSVRYSLADGFIRQRRSLRQRLCDLRRAAAGCLAGEVLFPRQVQHHGAGALATGMPSHTVRYRS